MIDLSFPIEKRFWKSFRKSSFDHRNPLTTDSDSPPSITSGQTVRKFGASGRACLPSFSTGYRRNSQDKAEAISAVVHQNTTLVLTRHVSLTTSFCHETLQEKRILQPRIPMVSFFRKPQRTHSAFVKKKFLSVLFFRSVHDVTYSSPWQEAAMIGLVHSRGLYRVSLEFVITLSNTIQ